LPVSGETAVPDVVYRRRKGSRGCRRETQRAGRAVVRYDKQISEVGLVLACNDLVTAVAVEVMYRQPIRCSGAGDCDYIRCQDKRKRAWCALILEYRYRVGILV